MFKFYFIIVFFIASVFCNFNNANNALAQPTELLKTLSKNTDITTNLPEKNPTLVNGEISELRRKISELFNIDKANVIFDEKVIFEISGTTELTANERANYINIKLEKILSQIIKNQNTPYISIEKRHQSNVILVNSEYLLTITANDLKIQNSVSEEELASILKAKLNKAFKYALKERSKNYFKKALSKAGIIVLIALLITSAIAYIYKKSFKLQTLIIILGIWLFALVRIFALFPETRLWQYVLEAGLLKPLSLFFLVLWSMLLLNKISYWIIENYFHNILPEGWSATNRKLNRALTLKKVAETTSNSVFVILGILVFLLAMGINLISLVTGAGLLGLALGFIAQDLIKDILTGLSILSDDQFGVGDIIRIKNYAGTVEDFSLKLTRLRNIEGVLITIPNKEISIVENLTSNFSQVDFNIAIDYASDTEKALRILEETACNLAREWPDKIIQKPEIVGIDKLGEYSITLKALVKTLPMQQWIVLRELNLRIKKAFEANNIKPPYPRMIINYANPNDNSDNQIII